MSSSTAVSTKRTQGTAVANRGEVDSVRGALEKMKGQLEMALPAHLTADRLVRVVMTAVQNVPKLLECDRTSFYAAVMSCAQLGLAPDTLGQAYLVPFKGKVQLIIGYRGYITLARNSGDLSSIIAHEVYTNDVFGHWDDRTESYELNLASPEPPIHRPAKGDRGALECFYAIARFTDGGCHWDVMTLAEVHTIRNRSSGWQSAVQYNKEDKSPWKTDEVEMGKKTVIRRIAKYLPMSVQRAAQFDGAQDAGKHVTIDTAGELVIADEEAAAEPIERQLPPTGSKLDRLEEQLGADTITEHDPDTGEVKA
jgi:recombination protein RecT